MLDPWNVSAYPVDWLDAINIYTGDYIQKRNKIKAQQQAQRRKRGK